MNEFVELFKEWLWIILPFYVGVGIIGSYWLVEKMVDVWCKK